MKRFICTSCAYLFNVDDEEASGVPCPACRSWSSKASSPAGRWAAHRHGIELDEARRYCRQLIEVDNGGPVPLCPSIATRDGLCARHAEPVEPEVVASSIVDSFCDWCSTPTDFEALRPVPGERVGGPLTGRQMRVCRSCARRVKFGRPVVKAKEPATLSLFDSAGAA